MNGHGNDDAPDENEDLGGMLRDLISRAETILSELQMFRVHLRSLRQEQHLMIAGFRSTLQSELAMLKRLLEKESDASAHQSLFQKFRSSNLPFLETVWHRAKRSSNLTALQQRVYFNSSHRSLSQALRHVHVTKSPDAKQPKNASALVDVITDSGLTWTKISLVTNNRLLHDLAKMGWHSDDSDGDSDAGAGSQANVNDDDDDSDVPIVRSAKELCQAAASYRVRTKQPTIHLVLPRVCPGEYKEVDTILDKCRAVGATVSCGPDTRPMPPVSQALQNMVPDPTSSFSKILNVDCTILLALVSEFSHGKVTKERWFHNALQRQVEIEDNENLLPSLLYPALGSHELVCTSAAAKRMREIVDVIGTTSEKERTVILLGDDGLKSSTELVLEMQQWSIYEVPTNLQLPIRVINDEMDHLASLPTEAQVIGADMTDINKSVFLYGWATGTTTLTSNRLVVKRIEHDLEQHEDLDDGVWPSIWLCPTARSLVGKEKRGAKAPEGTKETAYRLPDPLKRETDRRNGLDVLEMRAGYKVDDLRPEGYPCDEVLEAKNAAARLLKDESI